MAGPKLTKSEAKLARRAGKGGRAFVLARRKRPGMTLLEYQVETDAETAEDLDVDITTDDGAESGA